MAESHERYEELALGHVLGGLTDRDATTFRTHLLECRECRARVAELRDIAADLAATEREERRLAAIATQVAEDQVDEGRDGRDLLRERWVQVGAVAIVLAIVGILFWNYHLRRVTAEYAETVDRQADVLSILGEGEPLTVEGRERVSGVAAIRGGRVALDLRRVPALRSDAILYVWVLDGSTVVEDHPFTQPTVPAEGPFAVVLDVGDADRLVVTIESAPASEPGDRILAEVRLDAAPEPSGAPGVGGSASSPPAPLTTGS